MLETILTTVHVAREKLPKQLSYKKFVCKMLMKLTQGVKIIGCCYTFSHISQFHQHLTLAFFV